MSTLAAASSIPDQTGRTAIVTGANSGLGRATAAALAGHGARVVLAVRDTHRGAEAAASMHGQVEVRSLDLASLASIQSFAQGIDGPVDVLINNAGTMTSTREQTSDGFERQFGTNHLGHFALTSLLLEQITGRVVTVTSSTYRSASIDFDDLQWDRRPYRPFGAYGQAKLANLVFTVELQRRLAAAGSPVRATAADPGWASTGFRIASGNRLLDLTNALAAPVLARGPEAGSLPTLLAAVGDVPGGSLSAPSRFGVRGPAVVVDLAANATDRDVAKRLWDVSERLTGVRAPLPPAPATA